MEFAPRNLNKKAKKEEVNTQFEEVTQGELPFTFDVIYKDDKNFYIEIVNGEERIKADSIIWGWDEPSGNDTIIIDFPHYDSYIKAFYEEDVIEGVWVVETRENYRIPFVAMHGRNHRFTTLKKEPAIDLTGKWDVTFGVDGDDPYKAIGEFKQTGNEVTGTFLTETGDYRFLEGTIQANKMYLSCFDGSHAFLFEAKVLEDGSLIGSFRSGSHYKTMWEARKNDEIQLVSPDSLTYLKPGYESLEFSFPDENGALVSLTDKSFEGKAKIVQILGTWCPNCADETAFLAQYLKENPSENLAVIGLAFEKHKTAEKANDAIRTFKNRFGIDYPVLWAGSYRKSEAAEKLPMLNAVISYPTMIFLDADNKVQRIHTGFTGPASPENYKVFKEDFESFVSDLISK